LTLFGEHPYQQSCVLKTKKGDAATFVAPGFTK
jgi:hypothetical protein